MYLTFSSLNSSLDVLAAIVLGGDISNCHGIINSVKFKYYSTMERQFNKLNANFLSSLFFFCLFWVSWESIRQLLAGRRITVGILVVPTKLYSENRRNRIP